MSNVLENLTPITSKPEYFRPRDLAAEVGVIRATGYERGESPGWACLEPLWTLRKGEMTVLTGIPGHGKSTFLDNVMVNTAKNRGWRWTVFSAENQPPARHLSSLLEIYTGWPMRDGPTPPIEAAEAIQTCRADMDLMFRFLDPAEDDRTVDRILSLVDQLYEIEGWETDGLVIDPWNEVEHRRPPQMSETEYVSQVLSSIRYFARTRKVHVAIVAHPAKLQKTLRTGEDGVPISVYPVPTLYDIAGSAHWRNKVDCGLVVYRDVMNEQSATEIYVQKIRFREVGKLGRAFLYYEKSNGRYLDRTGVMDEPYRGQF